MRLSRTGWVSVTIALLLVIALAPDTVTLLADLPGSSFPDALTALASLAALTLAAWVLAAAALVLAGTSVRLVSALTPPALRSLLLAGAASTLTLAPAHAEQSSIPIGGHHTVHGLPLPDRPEVRPVIEDAAEQPPAARIVRTGDTLWGIAAESLPDGSSMTRVARETGRWHDANRDVIGDDPDLIFPAQVLAPPTGKDHP